MNNLNEITISEFTNIFNYLLDNNKQLEEEGLSPIAVGLEGEAGLGKTSVIEQVADKRGMTYCKLSLSQLEEVGDLVGYPQKEVLLRWKDKEGNTKSKWYPESMISKVPANIHITSNTRMSYAPPAWVPREENPNGLILLLDDFSRANPLFMQATMELINTASYISWKLPKNTTVVLTSNPDDGSYSVSSLDTAQKTRFINFNLKLDIKDWASWAEFNKIDSRCINFVLLYGEELFKKQNEVQIANPRAYTTFAKAIRGIKNWDNIDSLSLILNISKGCFINDKDNIIGNLFTTFINQKLDKLVSPSDILKQKWEIVEPLIYDCVYQEGHFRPEISAVLTQRLVNYVLFYFSQKGSKENVVQDRLLEIINNERKLFSEDLLFYFIKTIVSEYPSRTGKLLTDTKIRSKIL
jgi:hypothetical protein